MKNKGFCVIRTKKGNIVNVYSIATLDFIENNKNNLLQEENEKLKSELRGKENEINDLKERIAYLKQFKPKEKDIPIRQG